MKPLSEEIKSVRTEAAMYIKNVLAGSDKKDPATIQAVAELMKAYKELVNL